MVDNNIRITQITDNEIDDYLPLISGNNLVWTSYDYDVINSAEIYFYDGKTTTQITDNEIDDYLPSISGFNVAWISYDGNDEEIYFYDGKTTTQITDNEVNDY